MFYYILDLAMNFAIREMKMYIISDFLIINRCNVILWEALCMSLYVLKSENYENYIHILPHITYYAEDRYRSPWELSKRKISGYEFVFITEGMGQFLIEDRVYNVKCNDLMLFKSNVYHSGNSVSLPFNFLCIHFDLYVANDANPVNVKREYFFDAIPSKPLNYHKATFEFPEFISITDPSFIHMLLKKIINEGNNQQIGFNSIIKALFIDLLVTIFRQKDSIGTKKVTPPNVHSSIMFIKRNYMNKISLTDIALHVHLQPTYLSYLFKKHTGTTITDFIKMYRIFTAKSLLLETDRKVEDIANSTGFYDLHHFSKVFKNEVGLTPIQYRQIKK